MENVGNIVNAIICVGLVIVIVVSIIVNHIRVEQIKKNAIDQQVKEWERTKKQARKEDFLKKIDEMKERDKKNKK